MDTAQIRDADDPRVADFRRISDKLLLRDRGLFVAEGRFLVQRLLETSRFRSRAVLVTEAARTAMGPALAKGRRGAASVYVASPELMRQICGFDFHRGCLALGERPAPIDVRELLANAPTGKPVVVAERVGDADNIGGIFRSAAALGAAAVLLSPGCCDPLYRKAVRTSMGACLQLPYATVTDWPAGLGAVREDRYHLVALTPAADAEPFERLAVPEGAKGVAVLLGSEGDGLSAVTVAYADVRHRIEIEPSIDSLNVATAAALALHTLRLARLAH